MCSYFRTIIDYITYFDLYRFLINVVGNIVILMPVEYLIVKIFEIKTFRVNILIDILFVTTIEFLQFLTHTGAFDIDDILLNVIGMSIMYLIMNKLKKTS